MMACHIYEIRAHQRIKKEKERVEKLERLRLVSIHDPRNLITLCGKCHSKFDSHKLGIHPTDHTWIVTNSLREDGATAQSKKTFVDIHATKVPFAPRFIPPTEVLDERMSNFLGENSPYQYCHFCLHFGDNKLEFDGHKCGAAALPKVFDELGIN